MGLSGEAVTKYVHEWVTGPADITATVHEIRDQIAGGEHHRTRTLLPVERTYELPASLWHLVGITWGSVSPYRFLVCHLDRPCCPQKPVERAKRSRPAGYLDDYPQRIGTLDHSIPPEPLALRRLQPVEPVSQRPPLRTGDLRLLFGPQGSPPTQPALGFLTRLLRSAALDKPRRQQ